jgi:stearoyl-CoA desaturase (Delta-9 desaturase)
MDPAIENAAARPAAVAATPRPKRPAVVIADDRIAQSKRRLALVTLWVPTLGTAAALLLAVVQGVGWLDLALLTGLYVVTMIGVEVGFHRLLSHRAFDSPRWLSLLLVICGSMAAQGGPIYWAATHRRHHKHSDTAEDPHSPYWRLRRDGPEELSSARGFWHAQLGNTYTGDATNVAWFAGELTRVKPLVKVDQLYWLWVATGLIIPAAIGGLAAGSLMGALSGLLWGGPVRLLLVHHVYFTNGSFGHMYGGRPFDNGDRSANNLWIALPTFGSGYQNNHHAFPASARMGFSWWQLDIGYLVIRGFERLGFASNVRRATAQQIATKLGRASGTMPPSAASPQP